MTREHRCAAPTSAPVTLWTRLAARQARVEDPGDRLGSTEPGRRTHIRAAHQVNLDLLFDAVAADGPHVVALITEIATARTARAPKRRTALIRNLARMTRLGTLGEGQSADAIRVRFTS
jgi:hypothetical protein